jgi:hypothetical protein
MNNLSEKMPQFGKQTSEPIVPPVHELNYTIDGCPVMWLNVSSKEEAIAYYSLNFPRLPAGFLEQIAVWDYEKKVTYLNNISSEDIQ